ncbi:MULTISPECIES: RagB/SusD family nutrient uptake outer membrane protein [unclassified Phocaeicola]|jgi:hypothetical protein|uniref:RagB/SusD family nutrient uptake outer membrane protein n=1 Tax=unclassified Phocaeicola TaxID=2762211 RepID=UPI0030C5ACFF
MKINIRYCLMAGLLSFAMASCSLLGPIDDIHPENVLDDETVITDARSAAIAVNGIYEGWRAKSSIYNAMFLRTGVMQSSSVNGARSFINGDIQDNNVIVEETYIYLYYIINQANSVLTALDKDIKGLSKEENQNYQKEAKFNRAMANFMLLRLYGEFWNLDSQYGIVLNEAPIRDNVSKKRSTVRECYTSILNDLTEAETLPVKLTSSGTPAMYYANALSAGALKAKVLLSMGDFDGAFQKADEVIAQGQEQGIVLDPVYGNIFSSFQSTDLLFYPYTMNSQQTVAGYRYDWNAGAGSTLKKIAALYPEDTRYKWAFDAEHMVSSYRMNKYQMNDNVDKVPGNSLYMLRLSEMYLVKAEAAIRKKVPDFGAAREALRPITDRAGFAAYFVDNLSEKDMLMAVFYQKYLELFGENFEDWFDMVRYNKLDGVDWVAMGYVNSWTKLMLPIPRAAIAGNDLLVQNP